MFDNLATKVDFKILTEKINYEGQKGNEVDLKLAELIRELNIKMPIRLIEKDKYLVGTKIAFAKLEYKSLMVRVGGGYLEF